MAAPDSAGSLARLAVSVIALLWLVAAVGLVIEALEQSGAFRLLLCSTAAVGGALYWRASRLGGLPASLVDFDAPGTGLGGAPPRQAVHVGASANPL
jgi:hypothetical protein